VSDETKSITLKPMTPY